VEGVHISETSVNFYETPRRSVPEGCHCQCCTKFCENRSESSVSDRGNTQHVDLINSFLLIKSLIGLVQTSGLLSFCMRGLASCSEQWGLPAPPCWHHWPSLLPRCCQGDQTARHRATGAAAQIPSSLPKPSNVPLYFYPTKFLLFFCVSLSLSFVFNVELYWHPRLLQRCEFWTLIFRFEFYLF
jgi:hypothetical protein